uniref:CDK-activating kinase assembly factor MAT1 n=1 Tax=Hirondellea gigas TaxID=1518452 RepID=A0A2P2I8Y6_9CRUS
MAAKVAKGKTETYEIECPSCKTTKYRNPQMKLMVNECGHALCDDCVKTIFVKESGQCPECDMIIKRAKFRVQIFEDPLVEKEIDIRRKVGRIHNKIEDDFSKVEEYDDYLEMIEDLVYCLTYDQNKAETERKLESYERIHREEIKKNSHRKSAADEELDKIIEEEKLKYLQRLQEQRKEMEKTKQNSSSNRNTSLLKDLMASDGDASLIVQSHAKRLKMEKEGEEQEEILAKIEAATAGKNPKEFSSGVRIGVFGGAGKGDSAVAALMMQATDYEYESPVLSDRLPLPEWNDLQSAGYLAHVRQPGPAAHAGGYTEHYACMRALHEFMASHILHC